MRAFIILLALIASSAAAYNWEYLGMDGVYATTLTVDEERERVFVGTYEGFWYLDLPTEIWTERDWEDWIGRTVWAIDTHRTLPERVITGRENAWFKGYMEVSDDLGATETFVYESTGGRVTDAVHYYDHHLACTWSDIAPGELLYSDTGGTSWTPVAGHGFHAMTDLDFSLDGSAFLAGDAGVKGSWDFGQTWTNLTGNLPGGYGIYCVANAFAGGDVIIWPSVFASNDLGIYYSENESFWVQMSDVSCRRIARIPGQFAYAPDDLVAVTWDGRLLVSTNFGTTWTDETGDLPGTPIDAVVDGDNLDLYVITSDRGLYRFSDLETSVESPAAAEIALRAHPNPFNPVATLRFSLPSEGVASLRVYSADGRQVATVFDEWREAGDQSVAWRAEGLPSGVYLALLESGKHRAETRLVLLK